MMKHRQTLDTLQHTLEYLEDAHRDLAKYARDLEIDYENAGEVDFHAYAKLLETADVSLSTARRFLDAYKKAVAQA